MNGNDTQPVLRCQQCNKPFEKESTLKRHGYYCRSRRISTATRPRSCISCARGKARCDNRQPQCSRCVTKAIDCHYPVITSRHIRSRNQHNDKVQVDQRNRTLPSVGDSRSTANFHDSGNEGGIAPERTLVTSDSPSTDLGWDSLQWDGPEFDFADFTDLQTNGDTDQYSPLSSPTLAQYSVPVNIRAPQVQQDAIAISKIFIPRLPTYTERSLIHRPRMQAAGQRSANLMLHTLVSYPRMMLRHKTLPPFIHPGLIHSIEEDDDMEPLNNCISLVNMISSGCRGSRKLFWRNVRQECTRFCDEHLIYNKWELLAAMQALSIYILIRLDEGETDHNNFDLLLLTTVMVIARQLNRSGSMYNIDSDETSDYSLKRSWKEWLFEESTRRLCVVYQSVNLLVYFEPAAMCDRPMDLILAPLPAKKQLWEASDELTWAAVINREPEVHTVFALAANGDLVKVDRDQTHCDDAAILPDAKTPPRMAADWGEWYSEMDGFGGLVMLAASLVS